MCFFIILVHKGKKYEYHTNAEGYVKLDPKERNASLTLRRSLSPPLAESSAGALGLMQIMPSTAKELGVTNTADPEQSLKGGTKYLLKLWKQWESIKNEDERIKFTLGSYNAGLSHIHDAVRLTKKLGGNPNVWDNNVESALLKLTLKKYYTLPEIKYGYIHGIEPVNYVKEILDRYHTYKSFIEKV